MKGKKKNKIVFVCTGNTCRSPMAEALFKREVDKLSLDGLKICSAGIQAETGVGINPKSAQVLLENGLSADGFCATQIDENLIHESIAIVCMTEKQRDFLMDFRWQVLRENHVKKIENNVYSFSELVGYEIIDPYGKDIDCYRYVFGLLAGGMSALSGKLLTEKVKEKFTKKPKTAGTAKRKSATLNAGEQGKIEKKVTRKKTAKKEKESVETLENLNK